LCRSILVITLLLSLLPSLEAVELAVHLIEHGDLAHGRDDAHEKSAMGSDEHGCTGTFHLCGCHTVSAIAASDRRVLVIDDLSILIARFSPIERDGLGATAPPIRPPIS
jgi:hypothetical protein